MGWGHVLVSLAFLSVIQAQSAKEGANESASEKVYDVTPLATASAEIPLQGGRILKMNRSWKRGRVLFVDKMPGANWSHPAELKVFNAAGALMETIQVKRPPIGLMLASEKEIKPAEFSLNTFEGKYKVGSPQKYYALLINGISEQRHWNDFSFLYRVLTQVYGYTKENIWIADSNSLKDQSDLDGDGRPDIQYGSNTQEILDLIGQLKMRLSGESQLLVVVNDHGDLNGSESTIYTMDGEIKAGEFAKLLNGVKAEKVLSLFAQCFSGGFVRGVTAKGRVAMAASRNDEESWSSPDYHWDEWLYQVISAFAYQTHQGKLVDADQNRDGKISALEAFTYSVAKDRRPESPLLESHINSGEAKGIGLF